MSSLQFHYSEKEIQDFSSLFDRGQLKLNPGFQRDSVWTISDRKKLIESLLQGYPVPSIFLYKQIDKRGVSYDVIDGKQRLESVLRFQGARGFGRERFSVKWQADKEGPIEVWDWRKLQKKGKAHHLAGCKFQIVEVAGDLGDIIDLFVKINSTGKRLTGAETRHARFYRSAFLKKAAALAAKNQRFFRDNRLLSVGQINRMKHVELICELMASVQSKGLIDKKKALDNAIKGESASLKAVTKAASEVQRLLRVTKRLFPDFGGTRFRNAADFYSLFMLVWRLDNQKAVLIDARRNRQAMHLLNELDEGVARLSNELKRSARAPDGDQGIFRDYLLAVRSDTDSFAQRERREKILETIFAGLFERKDAQRAFSVEQRRILWHSDTAKKCSSCGTRLSWLNFTVDHSRAHARGGRTELRNASLMCRPCNSKFGKKRKPRRR